MGNHRFIMLASVVAVVIGFLPLVAVWWLSHGRAEQIEQEHMVEYATWTLRRTEHALALAEADLRHLAEAGSKICSEDHIAQMRETTIAALSVEDISFRDAQGVTCSGWGQVSPYSHDSPAEERLPGGIGLHLAAEGTAHGMIALSYGAYRALIQPERFVDVLTDTPMQLGIATRSGKVLAQSGPIAPALLAGLIAGEGAGTDGAHIYAAVADANLIAFAIGSSAEIDAHFGPQLRVLAPLGLVISSVLIIAVIWLARQSLSPRADMQRAIAQRAFRVLYQPIIALESGACIGAEALLRWPRKDGTALPPDIFIPFAETNGLIAPLTDLMIEAVVADMRALLAARPDLHISLNIAAEDVESGRFLGVLDAALAGSGIAPQQIWLEATERGFMNPAPAREAMLAARARGYPIAVDDFGTGYSSLSMLEGLPIDLLKIDKSFVSAIGRDAATSVVTPHIIAMAHDLSLRMVAEGVETPEQLAYLRSAGVEFGQGWIFAKPLAAADFIAFCNRDGTETRAKVAHSPVSRAQG